MSKVLYFLIKGNEALTCTYTEMRNLCSLQGYTSPVLISRKVMDNGVVRLATPDELKHMPTDEPAVKLAVVTDEGEILFRFDQPPLKLDQARLSWPTARHGEKTERGHPLYIKEYELFPQLTQR